VEPCPVTFFAEFFDFLLDPANWSGSRGIPVLVWQHLWYSAVASAAALAVGLPVGLWIGHTGRGSALAVNLANVGRAVPSFGIVIVIAIFAGFFSYTPVFVALAGLALPPIVTNTFVGIRSVDREIREAAEGMGMTGREVLLRVELPIAMPLVMAGIRTAVVQVVATATIAAFVGIGGLGRYLFDGLPQQDFAKVYTGGFLIAVLALLIEGALALAQRAVVPAGLRRDGRRAGRVAPARVRAAAGGS